MKTCAIVGINWGDEGKGRMVDLIANDYDIVVRYQGGGNAGHTVSNDMGEFALHLLPSGIFRKEVVNILGNGVALDPDNLWTEIEDVRSKGVKITPDNLKISDRASLLMPWDESSGFAISPLNCPSFHFNRGNSCSSFVTQTGLFQIPQQV